MHFVVFNTLGVDGLVEVVTFGASVTLWNDVSGVGSAAVVWAIVWFGGHPL